MFSAADYHMDWKEVKSIMINESAAALLGFNSVGDAVGQEIFAETRFRTIVGVVADFHQESLKKLKEPMVFNPIYGNGHYISVEIEKQKEEEGTALASASFQKFFPGNPFDYVFLDESVKASYSDENRFSKVIDIFTFLAIVISALGLISLASHAASLRKREIGIRKVVGASIGNILSMLSGDFMKSVAVASVVAIPVSYLLLQDWLSRFAYRITPGWQLFAVPVLITLAIAWATLTLELSKAACANPANSLKHE
jgi:putative ABC transport system permease protein